MRIEESARGYIEYRRYLIPKRFLTYDTRHFHKVFYGKPAPKNNKSGVLCRESRLIMRSDVLSLAARRAGRVSAGFKTQPARRARLVVKRTVE